MTGPTTYGEAVGLPYPDVLMKWQQLAVRATSDLEDDQLTVTEFLELLSLGEVMARRLRHPSIVQRALEAGATWQQVADVTGWTAGEALASYLGWTDGWSPEADAHPHPPCARAAAPAAQASPARDGYPPARPGALGRQGSEMGTRERPQPGQHTRELPRITVRVTRVVTFAALVLIAIFAVPAIGLAFVHGHGGPPARLAGTCRRLGPRRFRISRFTCQ